MEKARENYRRQRDYCVFDRDKEHSTLVKPSGKNLSFILAECTGFVFYVTNKDAGFLTGFNDHNMFLERPQNRYVFTLLMR